MTQIAPTNTLPPLSTEKMEQVEEIGGTLLYFSWAIGSTIVAVVSYITACQSCGKGFVAACHQLLDYAASHPYVTIQYLFQQHDIAVHERNSKSRVAGHYYLTKAHDEPFNNGSLLNPHHHHQVCCTSIRSKNCCPLL